MKRWHAELRIGRKRTCNTVADAIYSNTNKEQAINGIMQYIITMVEPEEEFEIRVKLTEM